MDVQHAQRTRDVRFFADAMRMSVDMAKMHASEALHMLVQIEDCLAARTPNRSRVVQLFAHLWGMIDAAHRLRELIQQAPGLKKNSQAVQLFLRATTNVEVLRNYVQHLRTGISRLPRPAAPLWGDVAWVSDRDPHLCLGLLSGTVETEVRGCICDTWKGEFAERLVLRVSDQTVEIPTLLSAIIQIEPTVLQWTLKEGASPTTDNVPVYQLRASISRLVP